jgi:septal ring factor EnvC (AmiA/AmiB activator)
LTQFDTPVLENDERSIVRILQEPTALDFVDAINYVVYCCEQKIFEEEREKLEQAARDQKLRDEAEKMAVERAKQQALREKEAQERAMREMLRLERIKKLREGETIVREKSKMKRNEMQTQGIGLTHHSKCHHSRE